MSREEERKFKESLLVMPRQEESLFTREEVDKLWENDIRFTEEYRRGVHENWGGRAILVYDILYRLIESEERKKR